MTDRILITDEMVMKHHNEGHFTVEGLFSNDEVEGVRREITNIVEDYPPMERELVQIEPTVTEGKDTPESTELGVRKLAKIAVRNDFFRNLAFHQGMVEIATRLLGPDVYLFQSMSLLKPPRIGGAKMWHQDNAYFRQTPSDVVGFWVACDDTTVENGCMHVIPGSHLAELRNTAWWTTIMSYLISHRLKTRRQFLLRQVMRLFFTVKSAITLRQVKPINVGARFNITILLLSVSELTTKLRILFNRKS